MNRPTRSEPAPTPYSPAGPGYEPRRTEKPPSHLKGQELWEFYRKQNTRK